MIVDSLARGYILSRGQHTRDWSSERSDKRGNEVWRTPCTRRLAPKPEREGPLMPPAPARSSTPAAPPPARLRPPAEPSFRPTIRAPNSTSTVDFAPSHLWPPANAFAGGSSFLIRSLLCPHGYCGRSLLDFSLAYSSVPHSIFHGRSRPSFFCSAPFFSYTDILNRDGHPHSFYHSRFSVRPAALHGWISHRNLLTALSRRTSTKK